jgi:acyl-[acyl-carrier-protein]-phospholipid O-acyltransferase/long-chain-fatty-acid--[acyl-carrier-protein] ligase
MFGGWRSRRSADSETEESIIDRLARLACQMVAGVFFRDKIVGQENVPVRGPALLVANHVTFLDGFLIGACLPRLVRFLVWKPYFKIQPLEWFFRRIHAIPVGTDTRSEVLDAIRGARNALREGHTVCIFAEGSITRTGELLPFKRGLEKIVEGLDVPIVPMHLDGLWGSPFSLAGGRIALKMASQLRAPVTISFGAWMPPASTADQVRQAIQDLGRAGRRAKESRPFSSSEVSHD